MVVADINIESALLQYQQKINRLQRENKNLSEQIEQLQQRQKISEDKIKSLFSLIEYKKDTATASQHTLKLNAENKQAKAIYTRARRALSSTQYPQAIEAFGQYLKEFPNGKNTADAQYWLAKSYLAKKDYLRAQKTFVLFQKNHPLHYKLPNSLLDLAKIYVKLHQDNKAIKSLNTIRDKFTTHATFIKAKALLAQITPKPNQATPSTQTSVITPKIPKNTQQSNR